MSKRKSGAHAPRERTAWSVTTLYDGLVHKPWLLSLILVISTFVAYQPTWHAGFIWDDDDHLTANPAMTAPHGLRMIWSSLAVSRYYPLTLTSFWVQRRLWGLNPLPYHLANVALHAANGVLIFFLLRRLRVPAAWLAAMLWTLHPVNVESVAWISELKNTQSGLFFFLAVGCFLRFETGTAQRRWYALALLCGLAAFLSKPSTVVLPLALLLCVWWERRAWTRADILRIAPFFFLALGMSVLTVIEQRGHLSRTGMAEWNLGMAQRLVLAGKAVWFYAWKTVWPSRLTFVYPRWTLDADSLGSWLPLAALVVTGAVQWAWRRKRWARAGLLGSGFFVLSLLPVLGFFSIFYFRYSYVADHFQYLACIGLIALVTAAGATISRRAGPLGRALGALAGAIVLLSVGSATWRQARIYQSSQILWCDTLAKNPRCWIAHNNLGMAFWQAGKTDEATHCWQQALQADPGSAEAHSNLGMALAQTGRIQDAIGQYEQALQLDPESAEAHSNLGNALAQTGRIPEAIEHLQRALRINPTFAEAHCNLGNALVVAGRIPEAIEHLEQALRIKPAFAEAHDNLGTALAQSGRIEEAIAHYKQALRIRPDYAEAYYSLGTVFAQMGRIEETIADFEQVLRIKPDFAEAHANLGAALARTGRIEEAVAHFEQALRIKPDFAEAHANLGLALEQAGRVPEAIQHYQLALQIKPDFVQARDALARLRAVQ